MTEARVWISKSLCVSRDVTDFAVRFYVMLRFYGWSRGQAFASQETLADELGVSTDTIGRATRELEKLGLLTVTRSYGATNLYEFPEHQLAPTGGTLPKPRQSRPPRPSKPKRASKPAQPELPGVPAPPPPPPRERSRELKAYDFFDGRRRGTLGRLGVAFVPESKPVSAAWITVVFSAAYSVLGEDPERVASLVDLYFDEAWPAKYEVPYNFGAFAKVWRDQLLPKVVAAVAA